jgi:hypothetical protein
LPHRLGVGVNLQMVLNHLPYVARQMSEEISSPVAECTRQILV